ncbi:phosphate ABC transporter permease PstA [Streptococcus caviae]|uniref:phosphate ABC transporter permease PstA n=1 Tax=Streptococcus sp. 'caviae' TaxID=1915004 RepID=UPI00094BB906|nr:phosphate ABC transporter permease PstA [Streptococcus sp. 'caviae']OLN82551.1 phosphate ABC transporter, permease protein PstA [Streptococcus sp. 'caviae']
MEKENINQRNFQQKLKSYKQDPVSLFLFLLVYGAAVLTFVAIVFIVGYILIKGIPNLSPKLFEVNYTSENVSLLPALVNTVFITVLSLILAVPIGIGASIYLTEYAKRENPFVSVIRIATETLSGIPSIIYGLFGALFFVKYAHFGLSLLSGAVTLSIMILPLIMRTTEEALLSVPDSYREGSFALGAGKLRTIFHIVLPSAMPGIFSGVILAIGRIVGESAALIFTAGTVAEVAKSLFRSSRTLAVHMYAISGEGLYINQTYATAVVLLVLVIIINLLSETIARKLGSETGNE